MKHLLFLCMTFLLVVSAQTQNVGIGTLSPNAKLSVSATGTDLTGTAMSSNFRTNAGSLGSSTGDEISLASIGFIAGGNNTSLGIRAYRNSAGTGWSNTTLLLEYDVDNTVRASSGFLALNANGNVGIGTTSPGNFKLRTAGWISSNAGFDLTDANANGNTSYNDAGPKITANTMVGNAELDFISPAYDAGPIGFAFLKMSGAGSPYTVDANPLMVIKRNGNVGIGTTSPGEKLTILSADNNSVTNIGAFYPANLTQGIGIGWDEIRKIGTNPNSNLYINAKGSGDLILENSATGNVGIGSATPHASAQLDVNSVTKGLLPPRMTTVQRDAIASPSPGLMIFNTTTQSLEIFTAYGWYAIQLQTPPRKLLGGNGDEEAYCIQQTSDGGFIVAGYSTSSVNGDVTGINHGTSFSDYWIVKLDANRNITWNKLLGGDQFEYCNSIQQTSDGGYIVAGYSLSSANGDVTGINHGNVDYWIVKLNGLGNIVWQKLIGGSSNEYAISVQQTTDGGYIIAGYSNSSANGDVTGTNHGGYDYWIVKLDLNGVILWNKLIGGTGNERAQCVQQTTDGGYIVAGYSSSSSNGDVTGINHGLDDYWIVKLDLNGAILWDKLLGGNRLDEAQSIQQTAEGGYIIAGLSESSANGDVTGVNHGSVADYWIVKLDSFGTITWNKLIGGPNLDNAYSIKQTTDGGYIVAGLSFSSANGDVTGINHGSPDYWIVKLDGSGIITWNQLLGGVGIDQSYSIQQTIDGGYIVAGFSTSSFNGDVTGGNHGAKDIWIIKLGSNGYLY